MTHPAIPTDHTVADDSGPLERRIGASGPGLILLWGHREVGRAAIVKAAARSAGLGYRELEARQFEGWDGVREVTDTGSFRPLPLEGFLAKGVAADPAEFSLEPDTLLYIRGLNRIPARLVELVLQQLVDEHKLLNNPIPAGVRVVAGAFPADGRQAVDLLGPALGAAWQAHDQRSSLDYPVHDLPAEWLERAEHWAVWPSVPRFVDWGRSTGLASEVLTFLTDLHTTDPADAAAVLFAVLLVRSLPLARPPSPHTFADLGSLLAERRLYFSSDAMRQALARTTSAAEFHQWLREQVLSWDPDSWIEAHSSNTLRGEAVCGADWLRQVIAEYRSGTSGLNIADIPTYASFEHRTVSMWANQELGDEIGRRFADAIAVTAPNSPAV